MKNYKTLAIVLVSLGVVIITLPALAAADPAGIMPYVPGTVQGTGTSFQVTDSRYLNVSLRSTEEITVLLESVPSMVSLNLANSTTSQSVVLTLEGLKPDTTYHQFSDSYKNETVFVSDGSGNYSWAQDLTKPYHVWFQEGQTEPMTQSLSPAQAAGGTVFLPDQCDNYGTWDAAHVTCTLNQDISGNLELTTDSFVLDCASHTITGSGTGYGILLSGRSNITVQNCAVTNFSEGIHSNISSNHTFKYLNLANNYYGLNFYQTWGSRIENITASGNYAGIFLSPYYSNGNTIAHSSLSDNEFGIWLIASGGDNIISDNILSNNHIGVAFRFDSSNSILKNSISGGATGISLDFYSQNNTFTGNSVKNNDHGIEFSYSPNNKTYHNNFIGNSIPAMVYGEMNDSFDNGYPDGGNYWSNYSGIDSHSGPGQNQPGSDGIIDAPFTFTGGQDRYPFTVESGWETSANQPPTFSSLNQLKSDGTVQIGEGQTTAEDTVVFKGTVSDSDNDQVKLEIELRQFDEPFTGNDDGGIISSGFVNSGSTVTIARYGLIAGQYHWHAKAIDSLGNASDWQEFGAAGNVDFAVRLVPLYTQRESDFPSATSTRRWSVLNYAYATSQKPYKCGWTIADCGCSVTSMVMIGRYYDINLGVDDTNADPGTINSWLANHSGYVSEGEKRGSLLWKKSLEYLGIVENEIPKSKLSLDFYNASTSISWQKQEIDNYVSSDIPVVAYSYRFGHYFVIDSKLATTYGIKDPYWYGTTDLNQPPNPHGDPPVQGYNNHFDTANLFGYSETPKPIYGLTGEMWLYLASPAEFLVTDPQGRKLGRDPVTNTNYNEIPNGVYTTEGPIVSSDTPLNPDGIHEGKVVWIPSLTAGKYDVQIIGTDQGTYTFDSRIYNQAGDETSEVFDNMLTDTGIVSSYKIAYSGSAGQPAVIERIVTPKNVTEEIVIARKLNLIDGDGVANSLSVKLDNAQEQIEKNNHKAAINVFDAFINEVEAQEGKHIDSDFAQSLIQDAQFLISDLQSVPTATGHKKLLSSLVAFVGLLVAGGLIFLRILI